jgi:TonB family protein
MGTVTLKIVLAANGQVTNIRSISGLPNGLTEKAIEAAHLIKFTPAMKDGHPVSQYTNIQFVFTIY